MLPPVSLVQSIIDIALTILCGELTSRVLRIVVEWEALQRTEFLTH